MFQYLGTKYQFKKLLLNSIFDLRFKTFADLTAGGCSIPYMVLHDWDFTLDLITNDINYYSVVISRALFTPHSGIQSISQVKPYKGFLYRESVNHPDIFGPWSPETASVIDGLIKRFKGNPIYIGAIGMFLDSKDLRFRNLCGQYVKKAVMKITPNDVFSRVQANAKSIIKSNLGLPSERYHPFNKDYLDVAVDIGSFENILPCIDLIYPPDENSDWGRFDITGDVYNFYAIILSSILRQAMDNCAQNLAFSEAHLKALFEQVFSNKGKYLMMWFQYSAKDDFKYALRKVIPNIYDDYNIKSYDVKTRPTGRTNESVIIWTV